MFESAEKALQLFDFLQEQQFSRAVRSARQTILEKLKSELFSSIVRPYWANVSTDGVPFLPHPGEPEPVAQVKRIVNALYHTEVALLDMEQCRLRQCSSWFHDGRLLYQHTKSHVYQACYLITHWDWNWKELFHEEGMLLAPLWHCFQKEMFDYGQGTQHFFQQADTYTWPHKIGRAAGIIVDQLNPHAESLDYEFITQFSAALPSYLDRLSTSLHRFSSDTLQKKSHLDKKEWHELQNNALHILNALERLQSRHIFLPTKIQQYIRIVRHIIMLSTSIFEQAGYLNEAGQEALCHLLSTLKYHYLLQWIGLVDKAEAVSMLTPGTLSLPLITQMNRLYQLLTSYVGKFVDFSKKRQDLLILEEQRFTAARIDQGYLQQTHHQRLLRTITAVKSAAQEFFEILNKPKNKNQNLMALSGAVKQYLASHYKSITPYVAHLNVLLNNAIIDVLTGAKSHKIKVRDVLSLFSDLMDLLDKKSQTEQLYVTLTAENLAAIAQRVDDLESFQFNPDVTLFLINEETVLHAAPNREQQALEFLDTSGDNLVGNTSDLTKEEAEILAQFYDITCIKWQKAWDAHTKFHQLVMTSLANDLGEDSSVLRKELCSLYVMFQPYVLLSLRSDEFVIDTLSKTNFSFDSLRTIFTENRHKETNELFKNKMIFLKTRRDVMVTLVDDFIQKDQWSKALEKASTPEERSDYVLKNSNYSKFVREFKDSLYQFKRLFNISIRSQLKPQGKEIPFPELESMEKTLAQCSQVLGIKRLFNVLYHMEKVSEYLEKLSDKSKERVYVSNVFQAMVHLQEALYLMKSLYDTPYLWVIISHLKEIWQKSYSILMEVREHYFPLLTAGEPGALSVDDYSPILYTVDALTVMPSHIRSVREHEKMSEEKMRLLHSQVEKTTQSINRILEKSTSYFKLFFEIPTMYFLFHDMKRRLLSLATESYDVVVGNLKLIQDELLTKMLLEADRYEDDLSLMPGTLTQPLQEISDAFYQGLLEPLGLVSHEFINLVMSNTSEIQRMDAVENRKKEAIKKQKIACERQSKLKQILENIRSYNKCKSERNRSILADVLADDFKCFSVILDEIIWPYGTRVNGVEISSQSRDDLLSYAIRDEKKLANIEAVAQAALHYFDGFKKSANLSISSADSKAIFLNQWKEKKLKLRDDFIEKYTRNCFKKQSESLADEEVGLMHCSNEYNGKLLEVLQTAEEEVVSLAKCADNIDVCVEYFLGAKISQFERKYYEKYYHLERIRIAIAQFEQYINEAKIAISARRSIFETTKTLRRKKELIRALKEVALQNNCSIDNRLEQLKGLVSRPTFKTTILEYHHDDGYTFAWLVRCIAWLLDAIGLYTPKHKKCYQQLVLSIEPTHIKMSELGRQFGLFSANTRARSYDLSCVVETKAPNAYPVLA